MKQKTKFIFIAVIAVIAFVIITFNSCTKAGIGGNGTVICKVYNKDNNGAAVNGATVYIDYDSSTPPSQDNTGYNDHKTAAAGTNSVTFTGLKQGTYYFYAEGNGGTTASPVTISGGAAFSLTHANRNGTSNAIISLGY
ncbi:MAG: fibronectin type III domain-containing protein [Bacteroidia bacterium]